MIFCQKKIGLGRNRQTNSGTVGGLYKIKSYSLSDFDLVSSSTRTASTHTKEVNLT